MLTKLFSRSRSKRHLGIVIQGPITPFTEIVLRQIEAMEIRRNLKVVLSTWRDQRMTRYLDGACDAVLLNTDPGPTRCNTIRQSVSSVAGLKALQNLGVTIALKTRTDICLSRRFVDQLIKQPIPDNTMIATNLFTRLKPFHISDIAVFASTSFLMDMFEIDDRTKDLVAEARFSRNLALRRFPEIMDAHPDNLQAAWAAFMSAHVQIWGLLFLWADLGKMRRHSCS